MQGKQKTMSIGAMSELARLMLDKVDPALITAGSGTVQDALQRVGQSRPHETGVAPAPPFRWQDKVIEQEIPVGSTVLDLGCGDGELLSRLIDMKQVTGQGIELDSDYVMDCVKRGVPVFQINIEDGLSGFPDRSFDYVVLEETLQTLQQPAEMLHEILRVGRRGIVSFPNFGYWRVRLDLGVRGRMPITEWLPYRWHSTPNIHSLTMQDFLDWVTEHQTRVVDGYVLCEGQVRKLRPEDNVYAEEVLFIIEKET